MPVFGVILVRIFPHSNLVRRDTEYPSVFSPEAEKCGPERSAELSTTVNGYEKSEALSKRSLSLLLYCRKIVDTIIMKRSMLFMVYLKWCWYKKFFALTVLNRLDVWATPLQNVLFLALIINFCLVFFSSYRRNIEINLFIIRCVSL